MFGVLYRFIVGSFHIHKWETVRKTKVSKNGNLDEPTLWVEYTMRCQVCGNYKKWCD